MERRRDSNPGVLRENQRGRRWTAASSQCMTPPGKGGAEISADVVGTTVERNDTREFLISNKLHLVLSRSIQIYSFFYLVGFYLGLCIFLVQLDYKISCLLLIWISRICNFLLIVYFSLTWKGWTILLLINSFTNSDLKIIFLFILVTFFYLIIN